MFTQRVILVCILSVHIGVIQCGSKEKSAENLQISNHAIWNDELAEPQSILKSPFEAIISDLENQMQDDFRSMEGKMGVNLEQENDDFPSVVLMNEFPLNLPINDDSVSVKNRPRYNSEKINHNQSLLPENVQKNKILDSSELMMRLLGAHQPEKQNEGHLDKLNSSFEIPLDIGSINKDIQKLIQPIDLSRFSGFENQDVFNETSDENPGKMGEIYFIDFVDDDEGIQNSSALKNITKPRRIPDPETEQSSSLYQIMGYFADSMQNMMNALRQTLINFTMDDRLLEKKHNIPEGDNKLNISIQYQGVNYFIPSNAYVNISNSGSVNITWISEMKNFNNSLCMKLSKDESGNIMFQHVHLRILQDNEVHEYSLDEPETFKTTNGSINGTIIKLTEKVGIRFLNSEVLDVFTVDLRDNYSNNWVVLSIAVLGLLVAGLIMLLSYIIHKRNQSFARKGSISKEPIIY